MNRDTDHMSEADFLAWAAKARAPRHQRAHPLGYRAAIRWMADNDDTEWVKEQTDPSPAVTAALVADIYDRTTEEVLNDLRRELRRAGRL